MVSYKQQHTDIRNIGLKSSVDGLVVCVRGCVRDIRIQASCAFIKLFDGSSSNCIQLIVDSNLFSKITNVTNGASLSASGIIKKHPKKEEVEYRYLILIMLDP